MNKKPRFLNSTSAVILFLLLLTATVLSVASYEYSSQVSSNVTNLSLAEIHSNSQIEASDLGHILEKSLELVSSNLNVLAYSQSVTSGNTTGAIPLFNAAQNSSKSLTAGYFWIDRNGRLLLDSNGTADVFPNGTGPDLVDRQYFTFPKANGTTFFSSATPSITNASKEFIFISRPVFSYSISNGSVVASTSFGGVVAAAINILGLATSLRSDLSPQFQSAIGLLDFKGGIIYSGNASLIGENVFGNEFQNSLPSSLKPEFDSFLNRSLSGQAGFEDISYKGVSGTLAYQPVFVNATTSSGGQVETQFGVLYVTALDTMAASASLLIGQERSVSLIIILGIAGVSGGLALIILRWNKRLDDLVKQKTRDLVRANEELAAKAKAERDLMNITAHELRTPTQSLLANSEILRSVIRPALGLPQKLDDSTGPKDEARNPQRTYDPLASDIEPIEMVDLVESSYRNAQRLQRMTQNILETARIDNRTFRLDKEEFDLDELIRESIEDSKSILESEARESAKIKILFQPKQKQLIVNADKTKIGEVVANLLSNAIKFSKENGAITINTDTDDQGFAVVKIKDEGSGIDPEISPKLFGKFATKSGTGLGLYIAKSYIDAHGGKISASSDPGGGSTFTFTLPLKSASESISQNVLVK